MGYVDFDRLDANTSIPEGTIACLFNMDSNGDRV